MAKDVTIYPVFVPMVGCPHQCTFCNQRSITGKTLENLLEDVRDQISEVMEGATKGEGYREMAFFGGSFTCLSLNLQNTILGLAKPYLDSGIIDGIRLSTRPDYIDDPILKNLHRQGVTTIELGIQSTDIEVLRASERGYSYEEILPALKNLKGYDFNLGLQMMTGLSHDTWEKSMKTALNFVSLKPDFVRIYPTLVVKGSALEDSYLEGSYAPLKLEEAVDRVKDLRVIFERNDIPIIRTGLQAQEGFDKGRDLVAGPYHPAFGEMVESAIYRAWMEDIIKPLRDKNREALDKGMDFTVNPIRLSQAIGQRRANILYLKEKFPGLLISIGQDRTLNPQKIKATIGEKSIIYERQGFISGAYKDIIEKMKFN